jgi:uncharacterized membrane protein
MTKEMADELHNDESVDAGAEVVDDDARAFRERLETANRRRLENVEEAEAEKREQSVRPLRRETYEGYELPRNLVDHHEAGILAL